MGPVLVLGHRNPDNDSVCSAVAYAHLKNLTDPSRVYTAARLGPLPAESLWVLDRFGVEQPPLVDDVFTRVGDVMTTDVVTVGPDESLRAVGALLAERGVRALPVVEDGRVLGLVTVEALAARYVENLIVSGFSERPVSVGMVVDTLLGELVTGQRDTLLSGNVVIGAMEPETMEKLVRPGDTLIVGDRRRTQPLAVEAGIACLIVTGGQGLTDGVLDLARRRGAAIVTTREDTYGAARLLDLAHSASEVMDRDVLTVEPETLLSEAAEDLFSSPQREAPVVDGGRILGVLTRTDIARAGRREVILVDHNEVSQSAEGIREASVLEILDHHRIGDVETASPIAFRGLPVGATATIVADRYRELDVEPPAPMAGLMLSAIMTDTVLLRSPTTTDMDRDIVDWLSGVLGLDATAFGMETFRARSAGEAFSADKAVTRDLKEFRVGERTIAVAQVETVDLGDVLDHRDELLACMEGLVAARGYETVVLMVTDIVREGSELLVAGRRRLVEKAFGVTLDHASAWFDGMLSRKKQVVPRLVGAPNA